MLFDEKDLRVFDNIDSRFYFKEILQSYYSQNYRATIVLLYSFVIYDLFMKLQTMANEGDKKATKKLAEINLMIADDEKYSKVENEIVEFFKENCQLYFDKFIEDITYLHECRNKCAHLKVNDNSLFVPKDYHARMLICSMYDNILSVKAPFIMDLFSVAKSDIEAYTEKISYIPNNGLDDAIKNAITNKYLERMTYDSLKKSYKTFIRLLLVSDNDDCIKNIYGLYAFAYAMTEYIIKKGHTAIFAEDTTIDVFSKISINLLEENSSRRNALIAIISKFPVVMDIVKSNDEVFEYISKCVLSKPQGLKHYRSFYPREEKDVYEFFKDTLSVQQPAYVDTLYNTVKECENFSLSEFVLIMIKSIPQYNAFSDADCFMSFFIEHLTDLTIEEIQSVMKIYRGKSQCTNRARHSSDYAEIKKYIEDNSESYDKQNEEPKTVDDDLE